MKWSDVDCEERNGEILGYVVRYNSSFDDVTVEGREQYNATLINLEALVEYNISIAAFNINGTGPFSSSIATVTGISLITAHIKNVYLHCYKILVPLLLIM